MILCIFVASDVTSLSFLIWFIWLLSLFLLELFPHWAFWEATSQGSVLTLLSMCSVSFAGDFFLSLQPFYYWRAPVLSPQISSVLSLTSWRVLCSPEALNALRTLLNPIFLSLAWISRLAIRPSVYLTSSLRFLLDFLSLTYPNLNS